MADAARLLAARCLAETDTGGYSNLVFKRRTGASHHDARDIAFAARLFYGALERAVTLDWILNRYIHKGTEKLDAEIRAILRCGLYQILYMDSVPVSAAVSESVELCRAVKKTSAAGLVNAVLRRAAALDLAEIDNISDDETRFSVSCSAHPALCRMLAEQYGRAAAEEMLRATLERPISALRVNTLKTTARELAVELDAQGVETDPGPLPGMLAVRAGRYLAADALADGRARVQSLPAQYAVAVLDPQPGETILDCCAAPGGKALTAAQRMGNRGRLVALDLHESRVALIQRQAQREGVTILSAHCADAALWSPPDDMLFDRVLCDVPCSGYGEMAAKPELRAKAPDDSGDLPALQQRILRNAAGLLKSGGRLVYATCTLDRRENGGVVQAFLARRPDFQVIQPQNIPRGAKMFGNMVQFLPGKDGSEGFFIACFEKMC